MCFKNNNSGFKKKKKKGLQHLILWNRVNYTKPTSAGQLETLKSHWIQHMENMLCWLKKKKKQQETASNEAKSK